jgi:hypothetical protein
MFTYHGLGVEKIPQMVGTFTKGSIINDIERWLIAHGKGNFFNEL